MKTVYTVKTRQVTETTATLTIEAPDVLGGDISLIDRAIHAQAKSGELVTFGEKDYPVVVKETVVSVHRGEERIFPRPRQVKPAEDKPAKNKPADEMSGDEVQDES